MNIGAILPVGTVIHSMLTTAQFASEYGDNWVLADGRSATGTRYAAVTGLSTIPDMRGVFLRGKGATYNPDGDLALGTYSTDKYLSHAHTVTMWSGAGGSSGGYTQYSSNFDTSLSNQPTNAAGNNETAPRSITVNIFIRIN